MTSGDAAAQNDRAPTDYGGLSLTSPMALDGEHAVDADAVSVDASTTHQHFGDDSVVGAPWTSDRRTSDTKMLMRFARPQFQALTVSAVLTLLTSAATLAVPMVVKNIVDGVAAGTSLRIPLIVLALLVASSAALVFGEWILLARTAERVVYDARITLFRRCLFAALSQLERRSSGDFVTAAVADTVLLREATSSSLISVFHAVVLSIGTLVLMACIDIGLLVVILVMMVVLAVLHKLLIPRITVAQLQVQRSLGNVAEKFQSYLTAIRTVKSTCSENRLMTSLEGDAREAQRFATRAMRVRALATVAVDFGTNLSVIVILALGAARVASGQMPLSSLIAFLMYTFGVVGPLSEISHHFSTIQAGVAGARRIDELERIPLEGVATEQARRVDGIVGADCLTPAGQRDLIPLLVLTSVGYRYDEARRPALDGVTLEIPARGHTAIVGPSGAGKTTLLATILRLIEPEWGSLVLLGRPYTDLTYDAVRQRLSYVEQGTPIIAGTVRDNLALGRPDASDAEMWDTLGRVRLGDAISDLPHRLDTPLRGGVLSLGQLQRIALARALIRPADAIILDEATSHVDPVTAAAVGECLHEVARSCAVISVTHRLSSVQEADTIHLLESGRVRASGTHGELVETDDLYRQMALAARVDIGEGDGSAVARGERMRNGGRR
ncbi:ABC transporter transmembrane domain-containing protein [Nocardia sp. R7R-8]|uniref:ABC transporter transmembrane domain-containing protein n=1 Tax=Nocardia sp. R7R-8 TaxID=3459304 RepID=UPI00403DF401